MQRFYTPNILLWDNVLVVKDDEIVHQLWVVLRSKIWENVIFFSWKDLFDFEYQITQISKKEISFLFVQKISRNSENDFELNLIQSLPNKQEKIEYIIQKWVEVWISKFVFFTSNRSQKLFINDNKIERFKKIIIEATEQSFRNYVPEITFVNKLDLKSFADKKNVFFHTAWKNSKSLNQIDVDKNAKINLFVWPEWGFDDKEIWEFDSLWFQSIYFWERILRTETTWVVVAFYLGQK